MIERETLERWVDEGLSLRQIADRCGVDRSTARRWLRAESLETARTRVLREGRDARLRGTRQLARAEARKCILVCSNCQVELEAGVRSLA